MSLGLLDSVELRYDRDVWPAGTCGTIVEAFDDVALVEICGEFGVTLAMLDLPYGDLLPAGDGRRTA